MMSGVALAACSGGGGGGGTTVATSRSTGTFEVVVRASDGSDPANTTNQTLTITVVEGGSITATGDFTLTEEQTYSSEGDTDVSTGISVSEPVDGSNATFDNFSGYVTNDARFIVDKDSGALSIKAGSVFNLEGGDDEPLITVDDNGVGTFTLTVEAQLAGGVTVASTEIEFDITDTPSWILCRSMKKSCSMKTGIINNMTKTCLMTMEILFIASMSMSLKKWKRRSQP